MQSLPTPVARDIFRLLGPRDQVHLSRTCHHLNAAGRNVERERPHAFVRIRITPRQFPRCQEPRVYLDAAFDHFRRNRWDWRGDLSGDKLEEALQSPLLRDISKAEYLNLSFAHITPFLTNKLRAQLRSISQFEYIELEQPHFECYESCLDFVKTFRPETIVVFEKLGSSTPSYDFVHRAVDDPELETAYIHIIRGVILV